MVIHTSQTAFWIQPFDSEQGDKQIFQTSPGLLFYMGRRSACPDYRDTELRLATCGVLSLFKTEALRQVQLEVKVRQKVKEEQEGPY
jgi:hypothetical protein